MLGADDERQLLEQIRTGERSAVETACAQLFGALRASLFSLCRKLAGQAEAEDVLQDVLLSIYRALPGFRGDARLSTWAYRIAVRQCIRHNARRSRRAASPLEVEPPAPSQGDPIAIEELRERLSNAYEGLGTEHRIVLALFSDEGLTHREIADILGVPEGTVWSRLHTARKRLHAAIDYWP